MQPWNCDRFHTIIKELTFRTVFLKRSCFELKEFIRSIYSVHKYNEYKQLLQERDSCGHKSFERTIDVLIHQSNGCIHRGLVSSLSVNRGRDLSRGTRSKRVYFCKYFIGQTGKTVKLSGPDVQYASMDVNQKLHTLNAIFVRPVYIFDTARRFDSDRCYLKREKRTRQ